MWQVPKVWDHHDFIEIFGVWAETRRYALEVDHQPRFNRFTSLHFAAKVATAFRRAASMAHIQRFRLAKELCAFAQDQMESIEYHIAKLMQRLRGQRRRLADVG